MDKQRRVDLLNKEINGEMYYYEDTLGERDFHDKCQFESMADAQDFAEILAEHLGYDLKFWAEDKHYVIGETTCFQSE